MRASDLAYFEKLLLERKRQILQNIQSSAYDIAMLNDQHLSDELDYASVSIENLIGSSISAKQEREFQEIEGALKKIEKGTYGMCEMCEEVIGIPRLKVKPHARYCIACREIVEKNH